MARRDDMVTDNADVMAQVGVMSSVWFWDKVDQHDPAAIETRALQYFEFCKTNGIRPYVEGFCFSLGLTKRRVKTLIEQGGEVGETLERVYQMLTMLMEQWLISGQINPVTGFFELKNNAGYTDKTELSVSRQEEAPELSQADIIEQLGIETNENSLVNLK